MHTVELTVDTSDRQLVDLTSEVRRFCEGHGDGLLNVFAPHSTVGLALVHTAAGADDDLLAAVQRLIPRGIHYEHQEKSPGHGADHILPALLSPSLVIPVFAGRPALGVYQQVMLIDLDVDSPVRKVRLSLLKDGGTREGKAETGGQA